MKKLVSRKKKVGTQVEKGVDAKLSFAFLDTLEEVRKSHKFSANLNKGVKNHSTLKVAWAILTPPPTHTHKVLIGLT